MTTNRIKEIQELTAHPQSQSVQQALLKVWNECEQESNIKYKELLDSHKELLGRLELINPILLKYADAINGDCCLPNTAFEMITKSGHIKLDVQINEELINKAKNIKQ